MKCCTRSNRYVTSTAVTLKQFTVFETTVAHPQEAEHNGPMPEIRLRTMRTQPYRGWDEFCQLSYHRNGNNTLTLLSYMKTWTIMLYNDKVEAETLAMPPSILASFLCISGLVETFGPALLGVT